MTKAPIRFGNSQRDFVLVLNKRVNEYFRINNIERHANTEMIVKTVVMFSLYFVPYALIISNAVNNLLALLGLALVMGLGLAGIGLSVMHDANHGAYSKKKWLNDLIGYSLNLLGATSFNWKLQHNVLHHSYTNIHEEDEDISPRGALRLSPESAWKPMHKYQHMYAWFLYGLMTVAWVTVKDFSRLTKYQRDGFLQAQKSNLAAQWAILIATKVIYIGYAFVIPVLVTPLLWWQVLVGMLIMHYVAGFMLAIIFQPAHVVEGTEYPSPDEQMSLEHNWTVHQLMTTTNFGNRSRWFSWYVGGLNFQIEHHLFPHVCHVHYRKIAGIVQATALEYGLPYKSYGTFVSALTGHARMLKYLGRRN
ncbi:MAG TPA: acyl-CoA desaturase [Chryseolinea sp.]|nr:acyl-CoA desaturase [Chryseolinea sp.]